MILQENIPLAQLTTFRIGGTVRFFVQATTYKELDEAIAFAKQKNLPIFILGGGSNILFSDKEFSGLIIKIELKGIELQEQQDGVLLVAHAGEPWDALAQYAVERKLWGIENLSGIPGTVGGAAVQNIGAYGAEIKDIFSWAEIIDIESGQLKQLNKDKCDFSYRRSVFKADRGAKFIITRVALWLSRDPRPNLSYRDLHDAFGSTTSPTIEEIRSNVLAIRSRKFPDLAHEGTAGSFFLNPVLSKEKAASLQSLFPSLPQFPAGDGIKISLAYLLDHGLHMRGATVGGARLFEQQPLVVVAAFGTPSKEVHILAQNVIQKVQENYGIVIEPEVLML